MGEWIVRPKRCSIERPDKHVHIKPKSMAVLECLAGADGEVVSRNDLFEKVWPGAIVTDDVLTHCVVELRKAFGDPARNPQIIQTIPKNGFRLIPEVKPAVSKRSKHADSPKSIVGITGKKPYFIIVMLLVLALAYFAIDKFMLEPKRDVAEINTTVQVAREPANNRLSIAVLPFENRSNTQEDQFFTDGMHDELLATIAKIGSMKVISRTSVMEYRGTAKKIPQIAQELGVANILEGGIQRSGNQVRINVQLIDAASDEHLWSEIYDRELTAANLFAVQSEITKMIANALQAELSTDEQLRIDARPTDNLQSYEYYLRGRYLWQRRGDQNIRHAITLFEQATELDPQFARAWSSLAATHFTLPVYSDAPTSKHYPLAVTAAQKALAQDDSLAEAYATLGGLADMDGKWVEAERLFLLAMSNEPMDSTAHLWYGEHLFNVGRLDDALEEAWIAYQLDPLHPATNAFLGWIYFYLNDTRNTLKYGAAAWDLGHTSGLYLQAWINLRIGEFDRAVGFAEQWDERMAERFDNLQIPLTLKGLIEAKIDAAKRPLFLGMLAEHDTIDFFRILITGYISFDRIDEAYRVANMALDLDGFQKNNFEWSFWRSDMAPFRQDPRFAALATELGMVDYWREYGWPDVCQPTGDSLICK